ncbi:MAG TPA: 30S ribosomal protein S6 [Clostridia bacterium]|nr:30S ribosomal protein S6 [Clostridia bacterium]
MNKYESIYILRPTMEEEALKAMIERFTNLITNQGGEIIKVDEWGKRRLAYPVQDLHEGYYVLTKFQAESEVPSELERNYKIADDVLRYLIIREDD